jgi:hypothetical protein
MKTYKLEPVGFIRSTVKGREDAPRQGPEGAPDAWFEIKPRFAGTWTTRFSLDLDCQLNGRSKKFGS